MLLAVDAPPEDVLPLVDTAWATFLPREDHPEDFDQQTGYVEARDIVSFCLGGNASGKTSASAKKCADFVLNQEPPRKNTPFWIIGATYKQVCAVCWAEKLWGQQFIPRCEIDDTKIGWLDKKMNWPTTVFLTVGQWQMGVGRTLLRALGLGTLPVPRGIAVKLLPLATAAMLGAASACILERLEAVSGGPAHATARYLGVRLELAPLRK